MKRFSFLFIGFFLLQTSLVFAQDEDQTQPPGPFMVFEEDKHDFGDITQGDKVSYTFNFENTGDAPLLITNIKVTCGCTATDWSRDPILPGASSSITVSFNSTGKLNKQNKVITIVSNASNPMPRLTIVANILPKKDDSED
jgi:hypothetical protein